MMRLSNSNLLVFLFFVLSCLVSSAQEISLSTLLSTPYIDNIQGAAHVDRIAFTVNQQGKRNVYVADGPQYNIKKLTDFNTDDGQEISSLSISSDGNWIVFVRGGEHGGNSSAVAINPVSNIEETGIEIYSFSLVDNKLYNIGNGDFPILNPDNKTLVYIRGGQAWSASLDRSTTPKPLFKMRGTVGNMQWSPDGNQLAFISRRTSHSFVGVYTKGAQQIKWVAPSYFSDSSPQWSPDGKQLAFVRRDASGGVVDSLTAFVFQPWSIMVADLINGKLAEVYKTPLIKQASYPRISGGVNLKWSTPQYLTFMSYEDGWPHLYRLDCSTKKVLQLTKGKYTVDNVTYDSSGEQIVFAANTGDDTFDFERSHIGMVHLKTGKLEMLTHGEGIETAPFFYNNDLHIGFKSSTTNRPVQPEVYLTKSKKSQLIANDLFEPGKNNFVKPEQVFITAADGVKFSAQYFKPANSNKKKAALVYIHGGPRRQMYLGWHHIDYYFYDYITNQYLASQGYAVLSVNYRMGTGYGYDFQHPDAAGNLGASEYNDIVAAGKWLQQQADVDSDKIGVFGGSYGGYLTAMALAKNSDIFKVGVDIHGVHNRERKQNPEFYAPDFDLATKLNWDSSPSRWVDGWISPVLIIHGDHDLNVPFTQSIDLFNRLKNKGVEVETLVLPDETHHWHLFSNLIQVKEATVNFFNRKIKK